MEKRKMNTRYMATLAMLCGVLLVMGVSGIGFIPLPVIKATTMHIPVILARFCSAPARVLSWEVCSDCVPSGSIPPVPDCWPLRFRPL